MVSDYYLGWFIFGIKFRLKWLRGKGWLLNEKKNNWCIMLKMKFEKLIIFDLMMFIKNDKK